MPDVQLTTGQPEVRQPQGRLTRGGGPGPRQPIARESHEWTLDTSQTGISSRHTSETWKLGSGTRRASEWASLSVPTRRSVGQVCREGKRLEGTMWCLFAKDKMAADQIKKKGGRDGLPVCLRRTESGSPAVQVQVHTEVLLGSRSASMYLFYVQGKIKL